MSKAKRKGKLFQDELLDGEEILWMGQPESWMLFSKHDLYLIPFSLFWCAIAFSFLRVGVFSLFALPHMLMGAYLLIGRFFYKFWRKTNTYYAVTNQRILIQSGLFGNKLETLAIANLPSVNRSGWLGGIGNVTFDLTPRKSWWMRGQVDYSNTGLEFFGGDVTGFYDIREAIEVHQLISQLQHEQLQAVGN
jgi:hypothetical protein